MRRLAILIVIVLSMMAGVGKAEASYRVQAWRIIANVFPPTTRGRAFRVAECETAHFTDFWNNSSRAKGLFQEMPGNHGRIFRLNSMSLRLDWYRISSVRPDYYAARVAYFQSKRGTDWSEWSCRP